MKRVRAAAASSSKRNSPNPKKKKPSAQAAEPAFSMKDIPWVKPEDQPAFDPRDAKGAADFMKVCGLVVIKDVWSPETCRSFIVNLIKTVMLKQPWRAKAPLVVTDPDTGEVLDVDLHTDRYIEVLVNGEFSNEFRQMLEASAPFHHAFGAPCQGFHLGEMWSVRQDPLMYRLFQAMMGGREEIYTDVNRPIIKYPSAGKMEFLHWDMNPFKFKESDPFDVTGVSGKVVATDTEFVMVPGSHTKETHREIVKHYEKLYKGVRPNADKVALDPAKPDPLNLKGRAHVVRVPAGCAVFWDPRLLHGVRPSPRDAGLQFGFYFGAMTDIDRQEYETKAGVSERADRIRSFQEGLMPKLWPSLDRVHFYPDRYNNFPIMLNRFVKNTPDDWPGLVERTVQSGELEGAMYLAFEEVPDPDYVAPVLTPHGERMLGIRKWDE